MSDPVLPTPEPAEPSIILPTPEPAPEPVAAAPVPEAVAESEQDAGDGLDASPADSPADQQKKKRSMFAEMLSERRLRAEYQQKVQEYERALMDGRLVAKQMAPEPTPDEQEQVKLKKTADRLRLYSIDDKGAKVYDWDAARAVQQEIREAAREQVAPLQQMTLEQRADKNIADVWSRAASDGIPAEVLNTIVAAEFRAVMGQQNAAQMLSQPEIVETVFERALGKAFRAGKLTSTGAPKPKAPAAIITEPSGRRGPASAAVQLSPAIESIYRSHGIDPAKAASGTAAPVVDARGHMELK